MTDISDTLAPKSDQLTADDLIAGPLTIRITDVTREDPIKKEVSIWFEGDGGKPYKPGLSMRRVLAMAWGPHADCYKGRALTLYRDASVEFGGLVVGGIRISHMSDIPGETTMALTATKGKKKPFRVRPLVQEAPQPDRAAQLRDDLVAKFNAAPDGPALFALVDDETVAKQRAWLADKRPELSADVEAAVVAAQGRVSP